MHGDAMGAMQRNKGAAGEREVLKLLGERLGITLNRNLSQTRNGGADCVELGRIRLEIKRQEKLNIPAWWRQAEEQAGLLLVSIDTNNNSDGDLNAQNLPGSPPGKPDRLIPALAYRQSHKPWTFVLDSFDLKLLPCRGHLLSMNVDTFCSIVTAHGLSSS
jgi:hypothetical protein